MILDEATISNFVFAIIHICVYIWLHAFQYLYIFHHSCCYNVYVFKPNWISRTTRSWSTYPVSLSDDLREDALHDLLERINIHEGLLSPNPWSGRKTELWWCCTQSFINSLETQTQQPSQVEQEPYSTEQGIQCDSHPVSIDTTPQVHHHKDDSGSRS